jgi:hypothetical protein
LPCRKPYNSCLVGKVEVPFASTSPSEHKFAVIYKKERIMEKLIDFNETKIEEIVRGASTPEEALLGLYKACYTKEEWDACKQLVGHPKASRKTVDSILQTMQSVFPENKQAIMMMWVNLGFSMNPDMEDWKVEPCAMSTM